MTYIIDSDEDEYGDKMTFNCGCDLCWIDNFNNALLDKTQMKLFLKECLDFLEGRK